MRTHSRLLSPAVLALAGLLAVAAPAGAGQFYKWVDEKGVTHYGEKPPAGRQAAPVKVNADASSDQEAEIQRLQSQRSANATAQEKAAAAQAERQAQALPADEQERLRKICDQHRKNLDTLRAGGRVSVRDAQGNPRFLTEAEMADKLKFAEGEVQRCEQYQKVSAPAAAPAAR